MGIPSYFSYIVKNHSNIITKLSFSNLPIHNLYMDCNSIIYDIVSKIDFSLIMSSETETIINNVCSKIDEYILLLKPNNNIYIAFDGVAPIAKLEQQRSRRYKSIYQNKISRSIFKDTTIDPWNTTTITPGTIFMQKLNQVIYLKYNNPDKYNVKSIFVSGSDKYGEGEHKLFEYIRKFPEEHLKFNTIIYGLDADLIMLSMVHLPISTNIYLFRETPYFIKSLNSELEPNENYLLNIPEFSKIITFDMNNNNKLTTDIEHKSIYDYIILCFFLGNDFMPHFPSINIRTGGIDKMINAYKLTIGNTSNNNLTDNLKINWINLKSLIQHLVINEEEFFKLETKLRDKKSKYILPDDTPEEKYKKFELLPMYDRNLEKYINPYKTNWQVRYYKVLFNIDINETNKKQICMNYLEGLEWTFKYYTTGCPDWKWCYKYNYPPLLCDLIKYIPNLNTELITNNIANPVSELVQLCYVLPKQSLYLLPEELNNYLLKYHSEWYNTECEFIWAYCRYFWESHVKLPYININELEEIVKKIVK